MTDNTTQARRARPVAIALIEAFDRSMTRDDLHDLENDDLTRFAGIALHWEQLAAKEKDRRRAGRS